VCWWQTNMYCAFQYQNFSHLKHSFLGFPCCSKKERHSNTFKDIFLKYTLVSNISEVEGIRISEHFTHLHKIQYYTLEMTHLPHGLHLRTLPVHLHKYSASNITRLKYNAQVYLLSDYCKVKIKVSNMSIYYWILTTYVLRQWVDGSKLYGYVHLLTIYTHGLSLWCPHKWMNPVIL
jgi:hypothetical protein